jgi:AAA family ATP:ADP antiporter
MPTTGRVSILGGRLPITRGERNRVFLSAVYFFTLMSSYYVLRPVRDEMGVRAGVARMPWLFTATSAVMLLAVPLFGWAVSRFPRRRLVPAMHLFFASNLFLLMAALASPASAHWAGPVLFVWVSVVSVLAVSASWSLLSDIYGRDEARRLFGIIAAGGSAGALAGPAAMSLLAPRVDVGWLLGGSAVLFLACATLSRRLARSAPAAVAEPPSRPIGGAALSGVGRTARSPLLLALVAALVCSTFVSTVLYFSQAEIVGRAVRTSGERTALFARMDLAVNALAILLQLFVTAPLVRRIGVGGALGVVAGGITVGVAALAARPALATVVLLQIAHRASHFAVGRPARETLLVPLDAEARYKAKSFIDTAVFRVADSASAWGLAGLGALGLGLASVAWLTVPVGIAWTGACWWIGRRWERRAESPGRDAAPVSPAGSGEEAVAGRSFA